MSSQFYPYDGTGAPGDYNTALRQSQQQPPSRYIPRTAINDLCIFLSSLPQHERNDVMSSQAFSGMYSEFIGKFMFWLIDSEIGKEFLQGSTARQELADRLQLTAQKVYSSTKQNTLSEMQRLEEEVAELKLKLKDKKVKNGD